MGCFIADKVEAGRPLGVLNDQEAPPTPPLGPAAPWVVGDPALNVTPITPELPETDQAVYNVQVPNANPPPLAAPKP